MRKKVVKDLEIIRFAKKYDKATGKFTFDIRYKTRTDVTPRTIAVSEAFGIGVDEYHEAVIYDNVELKIGPTDVVYIVGESGSGKSVLLKALEKDLRRQTVNINDIKIDEDKPLIDTVGETFQEGLTLLSRVGLNDAFLFLRRYRELSDGQRYRYRLAKLIETGKQYWVMDEFVATLDRDTAKIVAFNVQKLARKTGKAVLAATTHEDLFEDLKPSVHVKKGLGKRIKIEYHPNEINRVCTLTENIRIEEGGVKDFRELSDFHYRSHYVPFPLKIFVMRRGEETVGVITYSYPGVRAYGRKQAFDRVIPMDELNRDFALISRVVLHPKYRTIGLGVRLVRETLPLVGRPYIETIAVMAKYNPFFEKAEMEKIAVSEPRQSLLNIVEKLREFGFNPVLLCSRRGNLEKLKTLNQIEILEIKNALAVAGSPYAKRLAGVMDKPYIRKAEFREILEEMSLEKLAKALQTLSILIQTKVYLLWRSPKYERVR